MRSVQVIEHILFNMLIVMSVSLLGIAFVAVMIYGVHCLFMAL